MVFVTLMAALSAFRHNASSGDDECDKAGEKKILFIFCSYSVCNVH
jgi:hypothetical protein